MFYFIISLTLTILSFNAFAELDISVAFGSNTINLAPGLSDTPDEGDLTNMSIAHKVCGGNRY